MTSCGTPVKYLCCDNAGEHQSNLQRSCKKEKVTLEYTDLHTPQLNGVTERKFAVIKEGALEMLLNAKLNYTAHKILCTEAFHMCECVRNSMATKGSTTSIGLFSEFGRIGYVTKRDKFRKQMTDKTFKAIMVGYSDNHTRGTYKLYNPETKRVIMTRDVKWDYWKIPILWKP